MGRVSKKESQARRERSWRQMEQIVGPLRQLPRFFRNGLYRLWRSGLCDEELQLTTKRCRSWIARARKNGFGECQCGCVRLVSPPTTTGTPFLPSERVAASALRVVPSRMTTPVDVACESGLLATVSAGRTLVLVSLSAIP